MSNNQTIKTRYSDIKDISLVDFLDVDTERTLPAHEIWKNQPTVVIGMAIKCYLIILCYLTLIVLATLMSLTHNLQTNVL